MHSALQEAQISALSGDFWRTGIVGDVVTDRGRVRLLSSRWCSRRVPSFVALGAFPGNTVSTPQSSWNIDKLDGAGPSAYTFVVADLLNEFLYEPRFVWLGAKGIQYVLAGRLVHEVDFTAASSRISKPFARVPHMRVGVFMYNSGASSVLTFARNCSAAYVESNESPVEYPLTTSRPTDHDACRIGACAANGAPHRLHSWGASRCRRRCR